MSELKQYLATPSFCENSSIIELSNVLDNFFGKISGALFNVRLSAINIKKKDRNL